MQFFKQLKTFILLVLVSCLFVVSCKKDHEKVYQVPAGVQPFIDDFLNEAANRGNNITIDDLIIEYNSNLQISGDDKAGVCTYGSEAASPLIELDTTSLNWQLNEFTREQLIFHELGHCILKRTEHNNARLSNNNFESIMRAYGNPIYGRLSTFKRDYYLDELFGVSSGDPNWATSSLTYQDVPESQKSYFVFDDFDDNSGGWATGNSESLIRKIENGYYHLENLEESPQILFLSSDITGNMDFEIEMGFKITNSETDFSLALWGIDIDNINGINNAYYFGFSNDRFIDVGDFVSQSFTNDERTSVLPYEFNKLTIRKVGEYYYVYMNEVFFDIFAYENLLASDIGFYIGSSSTLQVDFISVAQINN